MNRGVLVRIDDGIGGVVKINWGLGIQHRGAILKNSVLKTLILIIFPKKLDKNCLQQHLKSEGNK